VPVRTDRSGRTRLMDIISLCYEISNNERKVFDEIRKFLDFLSIIKEGTLEDKSRLIDR
jgi:hypothetical protein